MLDWADDLLSALQTLGGARGFKNNCVTSFGVFCHFALTGWFFCPHFCLCWPLLALVLLLSLSLAGHLLTPFFSPSPPLSFSAPSFSFSSFLFCPFCSSLVGQHPFHCQEMVLRCSTCLVSLNSTLSHLF